MGNSIKGDGDQVRGTPQETVDSSPQETVDSSQMARCIHSSTHSFIQPICTELLVSARY